MTLTEEFKDAMATWASGVAVVTTRLEGLSYGLTVSSFFSVSLEPPLVCVSLGNDNRLGRMVEAAGAFAVSILAREQEEVSNYFAVSGREPARDLAHFADERTGSGMPVIEGALGHVGCEIHQIVPAGDHTLVLGRVVEAVSAEGDEPLVYFRRAYRGVRS